MGKTPGSMFGSPFFFSSAHADGEIRGGWIGDRKGGAGKVSARRVGHLKDRRRLLGASPSACAEVLKKKSAGKTLAAMLFVLGYLVVMLRSWYS